MLAKAEGRVVDFASHPCTIVMISAVGPRNPAVSISRQDFLKHLRQSNLWRVVAGLGLGGEGDAGAGPHSRAASQDGRKIRADCRWSGQHVTIGRLNGTGFGERRR